MSIEKSVLAALQDYNTAMKAGDIERQLAFFSEEWQSSSGGTKADLRASFQTQDLQASNQDKRLVLDDAKVVVDGDTAIIDPVTTRSSSGSGFFQFKMKKEPDGAWRCVSIAGTGQGDVLAENARSLRERILSDPARPAYHFVMPEGVAMPFDPNGAIYWKAAITSSTSSRTPGWASGPTIGATCRARTCFTGATIPRAFSTACTAETASSTRMAFQQSATTRWARATPWPWPSTMT